jgi:hypothetical protein
MTAQYFAQLDDDNVVIDVAVVSADFMAENSDRYPGRWVETFFDMPGKQYAGIGMIYDEDTDDFVAPPSPPSAE